MRIHSTAFCCLLILVGFYWQCLAQEVLRFVLASPVAAWTVGLSHPVVESAPFFCLFVLRFELSLYILIFVYPLCFVWLNFI